MTVYQDAGDGKAGQPRVRNAGPGPPSASAISLGSAYESCSCSRKPTRRSGSAVIALCLFITTSLFINNYCTPCSLRQICLVERQVCHVINDACG